MDLSNITAWLNGFLSGLFGAGTAVDQSGTVWVLAGLCTCVTLHIVSGVLAGALARGKGYSFLGNFLLGLFFGVVALIYEAGRPVSYERECVMQDRLALQTAKELYKLQRAREKAREARGADSKS